MKMLFKDAISNHCPYFVTSLIILLLALLLRLPQLTGSFWLDEAAQALESSRPFDQQLDIVGDFQPPLMHLLTYVAIQIGQPFGLERSEWWLRTWGALIPGLLTIFLTMKIAQTFQTSPSFKQRLFNPLEFFKRIAANSIQLFTSFKQSPFKFGLHNLTGIGLILREARVSNIIFGLLTGFLLATSSLHIFYSQELRPYSLPALWATLSWWLIFKKRWHWLAVVTALGLYTSYLYPFLMVGQLAYLFFQTQPDFNFKHKLRASGLVKTSLAWLTTKRMALLGGSLLFLPWLPMFIRQLQAGEVIRAQLPGWSEVVSIPQFKALPLILGKFVFGVVELNLSLPFLVMSAIFVSLLMNLMLNTWIKQPTASKVWLKTLIFWVMIPLLTAWLVSFVVPVVRPKRLLLLLPGFYLAISGLIIVSQSKLKYALLVLLIGCNLFGTYSYLTERNLQREDWRGLIRALETKYLHQSGQPQTTTAVFSFSGPFPPWTWYAQPEFATLSTGVLSVNQLTSLDSLLLETQKFQTLLVFDYLQDLTDPNRLLLTELDQAGFAQKELFAYPGIGFVREYQAKK